MTLASTEVEWSDEIKYLALLLNNKNHILTLFYERKWKAQKHISIINSHKLTKY